MTPEFGREDSWIILSPIEQSIKRKIEAVGTPLKDWDINIYRGILTGYNEAFIIDSAKRNELLTNCKDKNERDKTDELIRPILRGRDIKRYGYSFADIYLIASHNGYINSNGNWISRIDMNDYPTVKQHLNFFEPKLSSRADQGDTPYNLRSCAYMNDFSKPKIVWAELARTGNAFTFDKHNNFIGNTGYILIMSEQAKNTIGYNFLLAALNSKAALFYLDVISTRLDETGWRWLRQYVEYLPIPILSLAEQGNINEIIDSELKKRTSKGQHKIDSFMNTTYGFNSLEISYLRNFSHHY